MSIRHQGGIGLWSKATVSIGSVLIILVASYWDSVRAIIDLWSQSDTYGHGFLLFPISAYLIWRDRAHLAKMTPAPEFKGMMLIVVLSVGWIIGDLVNVQVVKQLSLFLLIPAVVWTILGWHVTRHLAFPLLYPLLAVPVWSPLTLILQQTTATASARLLDIAGVPVFLDGHYISIPNGRFVIAEVCAGLNYFMATLAITTLYAYLNYRRIYHAVFLVSIGICFSILLNWIRVVTIIMIGHFASMQHPLIDNHRELGWVLFALSLPPLLLIGALIQNRKVLEERSRHQDTYVNDRSKVDPMQKSFVAMTVAACLVVLLGPAAAHWEERSPSKTVMLTMAPPLVSGDWKQHDGGLPDWQPKFVGADTELLTRYEKDGQRVGLFIAYYGNEKQDKEVINELNYVYSPDTGAAVKIEKLTLVTGMGSALNVWETRLTSRPESTKVIWHWYYVDGEYVANAYVTKLLQAWAILRKQPGAAVIAVATENSLGEDSAREILKDFIEHSLPPILVMLKGEAE